MTSWQDAVFEDWWEEEFGLQVSIGIKEIARLAFHRGWDAGEDR